VVNSAVWLHMLHISATFDGILYFTYCNMFWLISKAIIGRVKYTNKDYPIRHIKIVLYHAVDISGSALLWVFLGNRN
jgi:hypothetical protein